MSRLALPLAMVLSLSACASTYRPIVDSAVSPAKYEQDLSECQAYAGSDSAPIAVAVIGGVVGLAFSALLVAGSGVSGHSVQRFGAAMGAISGGLGAVNQQKSIVARCMVGRGYSVLQ